MSEMSEKTKPPYFSLVGWSWVALGIFGIFMNLLGLLAIPGVLAIKKMLLNPEEMMAPLAQSGLGSLSPEITGHLLPFLNLWIPMVILKFTLSALLVYGAWMFLKGKRWSYFFLMALNYFLIAGSMAGFVIGLGIMRNVLLKMQASGLLETAGLNVTVPAFYNPLLILMLILILIPFALTAIYFHWTPVRLYFGARLPSNL